MSCGGGMAAPPAPVCRGGWAAGGRGPPRLAGRWEARPPGGPRPRWSSCGGRPPGGPRPMAAGWPIRLEEEGEEGRGELIASRSPFCTIWCFETT